MLNYIKRWHRITVRKITVTFGLPEDLSHHHRLHVPHRHKKLHATQHRVLHHHHPYREPRVLKGIQSSIGAYVESKFGAARNGRQ
jgi:hypothetical protein